MVHLLQRAPASLASSHHYVPQTPLEQSDKLHPQLLRSPLHEVAFFYAIDVAVTTQARQEIRIWRGLTQRHMGVRGRTVT
jgi:hypothetical protein